MEHIFYKLIRITIYFGGVFLFVLLIFPPSFENYWLQLKKKIGGHKHTKDRWSMVFKAFSNTQILILCDSNKILTMPYWTY